MTKEEYQSSKQFMRLLSLVTQSNRKKKAIQESKSFSAEGKAIALSLLSKEMSMEMCNFGIWVRNDYVSEIRNSETGTIDPNESRVKTSFGKKENPEDYTFIRANACGAYKPKDYFMYERRRIVQILKESYIKEVSYDNKVNPDRGGHNSQENYCTWEKIVEAEEENSTKGLVIDLIKTLNESIDDIPDRDTKEVTNEAMEKAMENICFLELNLFPGLFHAKSNDELVKSWADYNGKLLVALIEFYSPKILVGAGKNKGVNAKIQEIIGAFSKPKGIYFAKCKGLKYGMLKCEDGMIFIDAYHPSYRMQVKYELMKRAGDIIREEALLSK